MKRQMVMVAALLLGIVAARAGEEKVKEPYKGSADFERIKALEGKWEGTESHMDGPAAAEYRVTAHGSAVIETLFPGTPHEMVTIYTDVKGKPALTHYCALGNQPKMTLRSAKDNKLNFILAMGSGIGANEAHMRALTLEIPDNDHLVQRWTSYADGKESGTTVVTLKRVEVKLSPEASPDPDEPPAAVATPAPALTPTPVPTPAP